MRGSAVRFEKCSFIDGAVSTSCSFACYGYGMVQSCVCHVGAAGSSFDGQRTSLLCEFDVFITALFFGAFGKSCDTLVVIINSNQTVCI